MRGAKEAPDAPKVVGGRRDDVDAGVGIIGPVDRELVDPETGSFGQDEHLGIEEPRVVLDQWQQDPRDVAADRLEATLRVAEPDAEDGLQDQVVRARDQLPLGAAVDVRPWCKAAPDRQVAMP